MPTDEAPTLTTLAEARAMADRNEPLPEAFYIDHDGEVQFKPGRDAEPDRGANYYEWLEWWYRQPENQERAREIEASYIAAMQNDTNLD